MEYDQSLVEQKQEDRKASFKKAGSAEEAKAVRTSQADVARKAEKDAQMDARRSAAAEGMDAAIQAEEAAEAFAKSQCVDIHSDDDAGADDQILSQEREFMQEVNSQPANGSTLFREGMQHQVPSVACPGTSSMTVEA